MSKLRIPVIEQVQRPSEDNWRDSSEVLAALMRFSPLAVVALDTEGNVTLWNHAAETTFGWTEDEVLGRPLPIVSEEATGEFYANLRTVLDGETLSGIEVRRMRKDGSLVDLRLWLVPLKDDDGQVTGTMAVLDDITERKNAEQDLAALQGRLTFELGAMISLQQIGARFVHEGELAVVLGEIVEAAISITGADMGEMQLLDESGVLKLVAHRGFEQPFLDFFSVVQEGEASCGTALLQAERVIVEDVAESSVFASAGKKVMLAAGSRAVQSTPLVSHSGAIIGTLSTHWAAPHRPDERDLQLFDLLVQQAVDIIERAHAEMELRNLANFPEENPSPIIRITSDGLISYANPAAAALLSCWAKEVGQKAPDRHTLLVRDTLDSGTMRDAEESYGDRTFSLILAPIVGREYVNIYGRDITERKRAEDALRESETRYRSLFGNMLNGLAYCRMIFEQDRPQDFIYLAVNTAFETLTGLKSVVGRKVSEVIPGIRETNPELFEIYGRVARTGMPERFETYVEGLSMWFAISVYSPSKDHFVAVFDVITERKRAEAALQESEEKFRGLFEHMTSGVAVYEAVDDGEDFIFKDFNPAAGSIEHKSREEVIGKRVTEAFPGIKAFGILEVFQRVWRTGESEYFPPSIYKDDGEPESWRENWVYKLPSGEIVAVYNDITERKQLEAQLRQSQRMEAVGKLAEGIAHEFKNLLMGISGYAEILQMNLEPDHPQFETTNDLVQCVDRAATLIGKLQAFSRRQSLEIQPTDLNALVSESKHFLEHLLGEHIEMTLGLSGEPAIANVDPGQIEQVLANLAINARDAMPQGGRLAIKTRAMRIEDVDVRRSLDLDHDRYVEISVTDNGSGMDEVTVNQIFEPFFTTKGKDGRMGLGLSVTYGIVRQHKGFIDVQSEPGKGSSFLVYLPAAERTSITEEMHAIDQPKGGTETILLAEDEDIVRAPIKSLLEGYGYTVLAACDGEQAIELFRDHADEIDLAVLDLVMPKAGGKHVWQVIKETKPDVKVLFMSGHTAAAVQEDFMPPSHLPFLAKPFSVLCLADKIREILDSTPETRPTDARLTVR